jgi:hypothetical protein
MRLRVRQRVRLRLLPLLPASRLRSLRSAQSFLDEYSAAAHSLRRGAVQCAAVHSNGCTALQRTAVLFALAWSVKRSHAIM